MSYVKTYKHLKLTKCNCTTCNKKMHATAPSVMLTTVKDVFLITNYMMNQRQGANTDQRCFLIRNPSKVASHSHHTKTIKIHRQMCAVMINAGITSKPSQMCKL